MQILILSFHYPPDLTAGAFRTAAFAKALAERLPEGGQVHVVTGDRIRRRTDQTARAAAGPAGIVVHRGGSAGRTSNWLPVTFLRYAFRAWRAARLRSPELVVGSSSKLGTALLAAVVAKGCGARLHLDFRDLFTDHLRWLLPRPAGGGLRAIVLPLKRRAIRQAATVSATNAVQARYLRRFFGARCAVISNGIDAGFDLENVPSPRNRKLQILYAGNLGRAQAMHRILPALARTTTATVQWRVIGDGPRAGTLKRALADSINVELLAPVPRERLLEYYLRADVLFLHLGAARSNRRSVPSKIFEYAATGKPILAGVAGVSRRLLERQVEGAWSFPPECPAEALRQLGEIEPVYHERREFRARYERVRLAREFAEWVLEGV